MTRLMLIDVGTTSIKTAVFNEKLEMEANASIDYTQCYENYKKADGQLNV